MAATSTAATARVGTRQPILRSEAAVLVSIGRRRYFFCLGWGSAFFCLGWGSTFFAAATGCLRCCEQ